MKRLLPLLLVLAGCAKEEPPILRVDAHNICLECLTVATVNGTEVFRGVVTDRMQLTQYCDPGDVVVLRSTATMMTDSAVIVWLRINDDPAGFVFDQPTDSLITVEVRATVSE